MLVSRHLAVSSMLLGSLSAAAQPHDLIGYWQNWNDPNAPYMELSEVDPRYTIIEVAFAEPAVGTTFDMVFALAETDEATFTADVAALQAGGRKVLISVGGANATVRLNTEDERDQFVTSMLGIMDAYGFDGMDLDLEGTSVNISGGVISAPSDATIINLIAAVNSIADAFEIQHGHRMMLTMAPETAYVQGGQSAYGGIWGAYLPIIDALRARLDVLQVQLYNSGSMYGIDGAIYEQGTADFIVSQTDALLQGFSTAGGFFAGLPANKIAVALPACPSAAGGGFTSVEVVADAINYLRGDGPRPEAYVLDGPHPDLRGMMTWSINWDAVATCNDNAYEYARSYEDIFGLPTSTRALPEQGEAVVWPTHLRIGDDLHMPVLDGALLVYDPIGRSMGRLSIRGGRVTIPTSFNTGLYRGGYHDAAGAFHGVTFMIE
ncbi:MAG: chitinase [Flavobacteriales bacterium]|nr:chitinase [Flavobacteriales bacterium]